MKKNLLTVIIILVLAAVVAAGAVFAVRTSRNKPGHENPPVSTNETGNETTDPASNQTGTDPSGTTGNATASETDPGNSTSSDPSAGKSENGNATETGDPSGSGNENVPEASKTGRAAKAGDTISSYLLMGVDRSGEAGDVDYFYGGGQSDVLLLVVVNDTAKTYTTLQIDRDTIAVIDRLGFYGDISEQVTAQICLSYAMGSGTERSAENTVRAVSRLLGGVKIDGYAAINYDAIPSLNDTVGGIYVTIEDDFSKADSTLVQGQRVELVGQHALNFVRGRMKVGDGLNISRMRRQRAYLNAFSDRLMEELRKSSGIVNDLYNTAKPYMVTNMDVSQMTKIAVKSQTYTSRGIVVPTGSRVPFTGLNDISYTAFSVDQDNLNAIVTDLFGTAK